MCCRSKYFGFRFIFRTIIAKNPLLLYIAVGAHAHTGGARTSLNRHMAWSRDTALSPRLFSLSCVSTGTPSMTNLNNLLPNGSGWVLIDAWDINNSGHVVGYGTRNGYTRAFLLKKQ